MKRSKVAKTMTAALSGLLLAFPAFADDWKLGSPVRPPNVMSQFIDTLSEGTRAGTDGNINIELNHNFNEQAIVDQLIRGRLQMAYVSAIGLSVAVPEMKMLAAPYIWDNDEQRNFVTDEKLQPMLEEILADKGLALVRFGEAGWSNVYCKFACTDPDSLSGIKSRVSPNDAAKTFWDQMDTNGVQLPLTETWPALQSGVVDVGDLTFSFYLITPAAEVAPHYVFTKHIHTPALFVANKQLWDSLTEEERQIIRDSAPTTQEMRDIIIANEDVVAKEFIEKGGNVHYLTDEQRTKWREKVVDGLPAFVDGLGGRSRELYELIEAGKAEFAANSN